MDNHIEESYDGSEVRVLVTGFGTYRHFKRNPSWEIASTLPDSITHRGQKIRVIRHTEALKSEYHNLVDTIPKLLDDVKPDAYINIGQDENATDFKIERGARRDAYFEYPDRVQKTMTTKETKKRWPQGPERHETKFDMDDLLQRWKRNVASPKGLTGLGISEDAGSFVCGFFYYTCLEYLRQNRDETTAAMLMHVPPLKGEEDIELGRKVMIGLIKSVVETLDG